MTSLISFKQLLKRKRWKRWGSPPSHSPDLLLRPLHPSTPRLSWNVTAALPPCDSSAPWQVDIWLLRHNPGLQLLIWSRRRPAVLFLCERYQPADRTNMHTDTKHTAAISDEPELHSELQKHSIWSRDNGEHITAEQRGAGSAAGGPTTSLSPLCADRTAVKRLQRGSSETRRTHAHTRASSYMIHTEQGVCVCVSERRGSSTQLEALRVVRRVKCSSDILFLHYKLYF